MVHIDFSKLRFLVVDDNLHMRRILRTLLHGFGARDVTEAEDGASAFEAFTEGNPDIMFIDWAESWYAVDELISRIKSGYSHILAGTISPRFGGLAAMPI